MAVYLTPRFRRLRSQSELEPRRGRRRGEGGESSPSLRYRALVYLFYFSVVVVAAAAPRLSGGAEQGVRGRWREGASRAEERRSCLRGETLW